MLAALTLLALAQTSPLKPTAVTWGERVLVCDADGTVRAWKLADLSFDAAFTKKLNGDGLLAVARDESTLWGFDGRHVFKWDDAGAQWDAIKTKPPRAACSSFAVVAGAPVATCGPAVYRFTDGRYFEAPAFHEQVSGRGFGESPHAIATHGTQLAIGTGFGEWGGHLWLLDVSTGKWAVHYDGLGNAVGIAWDGGAWVVAWSMSHMGASTQLRRHGADAKPSQESPRTEGRYLRALTYDEGAKSLFALEQNDLVQVDSKLGWKKVQSIGAVKYGPEHHAVGVSPGIGSFFALGGGRFVVVPLAGDPLVVGGGKTAPLLAPATDGGAKPK